MDKFKSWLFATGRRVLAMLRGMHKYSLFILQIIGWVLVLYILTPVLATFQPLFFKSNAPLSASDLILLITAAFVLAYTYQTQKLKDETIFQRRMLAAHDVSFRMMGNYDQHNENDTYFGFLTTPASTSNVCQFTFVTAMVGAKIGRCDVFQDRLREHKSLMANYHIETGEGRRSFLSSLQLMNGEIKARVLVTNGEAFLYTFRAVTENWKRALNGEPNLSDDFILVKKEIDEY